MVDRAAMTRAHGIFDPLASEHRERPGVDMGRMFGTEGLRIRGKIYAFVGHDGELIVKVPEARADELTADGAAGRMVMRGSEMREWVTVPADADPTTWRSLIDEAHDFVDFITPR